MFSFESSAGDAVNIQVHDWPSAKPRATVIVAHGAAEHGKRYERLAMALNAAGYSVLAPDHRGHGLTGQAQTLGVFASDDGWNRAVADIRQLIGIARERAAVPVVLMGHSMGSFMAQQCIAEFGHELDAVVLSGSTILDGFGELVPVLAAEIEQQGRDLPSPVMTQMMGSGMGGEFTDGDTGYEWLSRDKAEVQKYVDDPLCGFGLSSGAWYDMIANNRLASGPEGFAHTPKSLPIYLFAGDKDPINGALAGVYALENLYAAAGFLSVISRYYPDGRHEMLNEINRDEVTEDLIRWLNENV